MTILALADADTGVYTVTTSGAAYQVDLTGRTIVRSPLGGHGKRLDHERHPLLRLVHCAVGARAVIAYSPFGGVDFIRTTSVVLAIEPAA